MRFRFELDASLAGIAEEEIRSAERAVTGGVREIGTLVKNAWRGQVVSSGLGTRLANTIRQNNYPAAGESIGAASLVYARPNRKKSASAADVVDAFDKGALIKSRDAFWLAVPLPAAGPVFGTNMRGRLTPAIWEQRTGRQLKFVYRKGKPPLLVDEGKRLPGNELRSSMSRRGFHTTKRARTFKNREIPIFVLLPQAKLKKRLDLEEAARAAEARLPQAILSRWK